MSDKGDKLCPICTEEMDLTDQQLKPCNCGYEICVWCWNKIMELADIENLKGCCPACRSPYDKEKIVRMAANCERLVTEINTEKKLKSHKVKPKLSDGRMHLTNVRVIQRNLVYIIGLPLNLADEDLLQRREYFGQYGKVLKVSISKTATGVIQHSSNNSCCVYITYMKEEEAVRCIQSVHSFVLDGRSLRACFGTTKYCHAWLKNMPCSIPDCLYLHEFGSEEDSFTKDDLVSAFTRSRVQQTIGATNNTHRSGTVLPPPADEYSDRSMSSMIKADCASPLNNNADHDKGSHVDGVTERSNVNTGATSWVKRISSNVPLAKSLSVLDGNLSHKPETETVSMKRPNDIKRASMDEGSCQVGPTPNISGVANSCAGVNSTCSKALAEDSIPKVNADSVIMGGSTYNSHNPPMSEGSQQVVNCVKVDPSAPLETTESSNVGFDEQELKGSGVSPSLPSTSCLHFPMQNNRLPNSHSWLQRKTNQESNGTQHPITAPKYDGTDFSLGSDKPESCDVLFGYRSSNHQETANCSSGLPDIGLNKYLKAHEIAESRADSKADLDIGESSIISSILSMDLDTWEDTLTSPQSIFKLLNEKQNGTLKIPSIKKAQESCQSRFLFARQDDFCNRDSHLGHSFANRTNQPSAFDRHNDKKDISMAKCNDVSSYGGSVNSVGSLSSHPFPTSTFAVPKTPISPPGFALPSRVVPPGFPTHSASNYDENHLFQNSSSRNVGSCVDFDFIDPAIKEVGGGMMSTRLRNQSFEMRPAMSPHVSSHDSQFQNQQPISVKQNHWFPDHLRNRFSPQNDAYSISPNNASPFSQVTPQHVRNIHMPSSCWAGWDDMKSGMSELLMNGRAGLSKIIPSTDDMKYQMSGSNTIYNRGFAM